MAAGVRELGMIVPADEHLIFDFTAAMPLAR